MKWWIGLAAMMLLAACGPRERGVVLPNQTAFRITLGVSDREPCDWSGTVEVQGGRVASISPWRFDQEDKLLPDGVSWTCATRRAPVPDPQLWWLAAVPPVADETPPAQGELIPNGFQLTLESASEVRIRTKQGSFRFEPDHVLFGQPMPALNGRVVVERVPAALNLTAADEREDDFPSLAFDSDANPWAAWISYRNEKEVLAVGPTNGAERQTVAEGEFSRPALVAGESGQLFLLVSVRSGQTWKIGMVRRRGGKWGGLELVSAGGPDLGPRGAVDPGGNLWVVWQGFRDGRLRILGRRFNGAEWGPELAISENKRNAWDPSVAADAKGRLHFAWDAYDAGNYDIYYRQFDGRQLQAQRQITRSRRFQAHVALACDASNRPWLAWDEAGEEWGKDTGFFVPGKVRGEGLYEQRQVQVAVLAGDSILAPPPLEGFLEQPQLVKDQNGNVWTLVRRRTTKLHGVWSPALQRNRWQQHSIWDYALLRYVKGTESIPLPFSAGRNDQRAAIAASPTGRLTVVWSGDGRRFSRPYPYVKHDIYTADVPGVPYGEPALQPWKEAGDQRRLRLHENEADQVERAREWRIETGGEPLVVLRGDLHRHTDLSFDGDSDGSVEDAYRYLIDAADLDFGAVTDDDAGDEARYYWWLLQKSSDLYNLPGRFTTLCGYEQSLPFPKGSRNLIWPRRGMKALRLPAAREGDMGSLYDYLRQSGGIAIPHSLATVMGTNWSGDDPELEPVTEIFQGALPSEGHEGGLGVAVPTDPPTQPGRFKPEGAVWKAWAKGLKLGVLASSGHSSTHTAYSILLASDKTRGGIFKAIRGRHSYAATDNILLDFRSDGHIQGDVVEMTGRPKFEIRVEGTAPVDKLEVIRNEKPVFSAAPRSASVRLRYEDQNPTSGQLYYYVRILQSDGQIAWSSPIWVERRP